MPYHLLIVDDDPEFLRQISDFLRSQDLIVETAGSVDEALEQWRRGRFHMALIDRRLAGNDPRDISGQTLARTISTHIPCLLMTKWGLPNNDWDAVAVAAEGIPLLDKTLRLPEVAAQVVQQLEQRVTIDWTLKLQGRVTLAELAASLASAGDHTLSLDTLSGDLEDLFRTLFAGYARASIERVYYKRGDHLVVHVIAQRDQGIVDQFLVLCGWRAPMEMARIAYDRHAPRYAGDAARGAVSARLHVAGICFTALHTSPDCLRSFGEQYASGVVEQLDAALSALFETGLAPWYVQQSNRVEGRAVFEHYLHWFGVATSELTQGTVWQRIRPLSERFVNGHTALHCSERTIAVRRPDEAELVYPNPLIHLQWEKLTRNLVARCGVAHAGIDLLTLLVDTHARRGCMIELAGVVPFAPLQATFVQLEVGLRYDLLDGPDLFERLRFEQVLVDATTLDQQLDTSGLSPAACKALHLIRRIRQLAASTTGEHTMDSYHIGVFCAALQRLVRYAPEEFYTPSQQLAFAQVLYSATLLYHRRIGGPEPSRATEGLFIDDATREVRVNGRPVRLTQQQYRLLHYGYERAGSVCSHWAIARDLFGATDTAVPDGVSRELHQSDETSKHRRNIDTMIHRLRRAIEDNQEQPEYIITERGQGLIVYRTPYKAQRTDTLERIV